MTDPMSYLEAGGFTPAAAARAHRIVTAQAREAAGRIAMASVDNCDTCDGDQVVATFHTTAGGDTRLEEPCPTCGGTGRKRTQE